MSSPPPPSQRSFRPRRFIKGPDNQAHNAKVAELRAQIDVISKQIDKAVVGSAIVEERKTLTEELKGLMKEQAAMKEQRQAVNNQLKSVEAEVKRKVKEIESVFSKNSFKSVGAIDKRISEIDEQVESGALKLVDEKRLIKEQQSLFKLRKDFSSVEAQQKSIDSDKAKIDELKKKLSGIRNDAVHKRFEEVQKKLDALRSSNDGIQTKRNALFSQRQALHDQIKALRAAHDAEFKKFKADIELEQKKREEEEASYKAEKEKSDLVEKIAKLEQEATLPAFTKEIDSIHGLLGFFDPSYVKPQLSILPAETFVSKSNIRVVNPDTEFVVLKKERESFFVGTGGKKTKSKKNKAKFTVEPVIIAQLADLNVALPTSQEQVPATIEALKTKLAELEANQDAETKKNSDKVKAKIADLEAKVAALSVKPEATEKAPESTPEAAEVAEATEA
ncbi:unnamed protein product [Kuraishia capsulata CBS 1993]|uniref:Nuclear segregation protein BFR1 n=1 Tax=Kuraishia capsulata CBS 1993 TaxID=1382522 RepID=W6MRE2_9ASCO|nr:uncharacterized protein KUCA_T00004919001 [Kuraishia capsulata CBS 1993]CDK28933.1 unnamed protein product [Kuraishia capsulata CBS 1993]